jgi:predicted PurR-regulated permease PerM
VPVSAGWCYVIVVCSVVILIAVWAYFLGPRIVDEGHEIVKAIPGSIARIRSSMDQYEWGRDFIRMVNNSMQRQQTTGWANTLATDSLDAIADAVVIVAIALFLGSNPSLYRRGLLYLFPGRHRQRAAEILDTVGSCMTGWLLGQLIPMAALGIGTIISLWILGIPLAFTLGLFTGLMLFIPYVGSVIAYIPTALIAFTKGPHTVIYVTVVYIGVHVAEGYVITPLAQKHAVRLPPALTLLSQLFMWKIAGLLGVIVATPLAAGVLAVVQKFRRTEPASSGTRSSNG